MLPSPDSSPQPVLHNRTNVLNTPIQTKLSFALPTPPYDKNSKRPTATGHFTELKKRKIGFEERRDAPSGSEDSENDSEDDEEMEHIAVSNARARRYITFQRSMRAVMRVPGRARQEAPPTRTILESFVSSNKSDVFKCESNNENAFLTPPYACSYSHGAKKGDTSLLAVATEQGTLQLLNTLKRKDWDPELPRTSLQIHHNGIFDVKWNTDDTLLATCSGDHSTRITCPTTETVTYALQGHTHTVKCAAWDPRHRELLSTGGRDGSICIWDLRLAGHKEEDGLTVLSPVISIPGAHEEAKPKRGPRGKNVPAPKSITSLLYPEMGSYGLISSCSSDGVLKYWDLRLPAGARKTKSSKPKPPENLYSSTVDPTTRPSTCHGFPTRPRGIARLTSGVGPTAGLVFGVGADSRIHAYGLPSLETIPASFTHEKMQTNSFYVGLSMSPCGRWLACGSSPKESGTSGNAFLFDVANAARPSRMAPQQRGVQLTGQQGEVGAVDWAQEMLATCADDGTVRVWRPEINTYHACLEREEDSRWDWSWGV